VVVEIALKDTLQQKRPQYVSYAQTVRSPWQQKVQVVQFALLEKLPTMTGQNVYHVLLESIEVRQWNYVSHVKQVTFRSTVGSLVCLVHRVSQLTVMIVQNVKYVVQENIKSQREKVVVKNAQQASTLGLQRKATIYVSVVTQVQLLTLQVRVLRVAKTVHPENIQTISVIPQPYV
jgi:hypothetical protein